MAHVFRFRIKSKLIKHRFIHSQWGISRTGRTLPQKLLDRKKGQHILKTESILERIVSCAHLSKDDVVLEIGSGSGNMTIRILEQCSKVYAVDIDKSLTNILSKRVNKFYPEFAHKLQCIIGDVMHPNMQIPNDVDCVISNVPYQISTELIFKLLSESSNCKWKRAFLLFQKEFIQKLVSQPNSKQYSRLSVSAQMHCKINWLFQIDKFHFVPPPNVQSALIELIPHEQNKKILSEWNINEYNEWNEFLKICFFEKNKKLPTVFDNALKATKCKMKIAPSSGENVAVVLKQVFAETNMEKNRANGTEIDSFLKLFHKMRSHNIQFS